MFVLIGDQGNTLCLKSSHEFGNSLYLYPLGTQLYIDMQAQNKFQTVLGAHWESRAPHNKTTARELQPLRWNSANEQSSAVQSGFHLLSHLLPQESQLNGLNLMPCSESNGVCL